MKSIKALTFMLLLCLFAGRKAHAQSTWARAYDLSSIIPGATWTEIRKIITTSDDKFVVLGTITGAGHNNVVLAKFQKVGTPIWVHELKGDPGSTIQCWGLAESNDAANPGYAVCGWYIGSGSTLNQNYLARVDGDGNFLWDRIWQLPNGPAAPQESRLAQVLFPQNGSNDIVCTGYEKNPVSLSLNVTVYGFDNSGNLLNGKVLEMDLSSVPHDILEDPNFSAGGSTGGFFILAGYAGPTTWLQPCYYFIDYTFAVKQSHILNYATTPTNLYQLAGGIRMKQDKITGELYILAYARDGWGTTRGFRPSVIKFNPTTLAIQTVVQAAPFVTTATENFFPSDIHLLKDNAAEGIMVTSNYTTSSGQVKPYTWLLNNSLVTQNIIEDQLIQADIKNGSLTASPANDHYIVAGCNSQYLTLNEVELTGDKVYLDGHSACVHPETFIDEHPKIIPNIFTLNTTSLTINPFSPGSSQDYSWWFTKACDCREENTATYFRRSLSGPLFDDWGLDVNRSSMGPVTGNVYVTNTDLMDNQTRAIMVDGSGQSPKTYKFVNNTPAGGTQEGRQTIETANSDIIMACRYSPGPGIPSYLSISRFFVGGGMVWVPEIAFPGAQSPGHIFIAEDTRTGDIIVVADIDAPNQNATTHDLMICRITSGGTLLYYKEIPIMYNGMPRNSFQVLGLTATRDGGYVICGSSGENGDFIGGHVMKFDAGGLATGTMAWQYVFRRQTGTSCYDLNNPPCRSSSAFYQARAQGPNLFYVVGYTSDQDANGQNASFRNGLVVTLDGSGNELNVYEYAAPGGYFATFKGLTLTASDVAIVGGVQNTIDNTQTDLFVQLDKATMSVQNAYTYGQKGNSTLLDIFISPTGNGYTMTGTTTDWYDVRTPQIIGADFTGANGCENALQLMSATPVNDPVSLDLQTPADRNAQDMYYEAPGTCVDVYTICPTPVYAPVMLGMQDNLNSEDEAITAYPNPSSGKLTVELNVASPSRIALTLYDVQGRMVFARTETLAAGNATLQLDIASLKTGLYLLKVSDDKGNTYPSVKIRKN